PGEPRSSITAITASRKSCSGSCRCWSKATAPSASRSSISIYEIEKKALTCSSPPCPRRSLHDRQIAVTDLQFLLDGRYPGGCPGSQSSTDSRRPDRSPVETRVFGHVRESAVLLVVQAFPLARHALHFQPGAVLVPTSDLPRPTRRDCRPHHVHCARAFCFARSTAE